MGLSKVNLHVPWMPATYVEVQLIGTSRGLSKKIRAAAGVEPKLASASF